MLAKLELAQTNAQQLGQFFYNVKTSRLNYQDLWTSSYGSQWISKIREFAKLELAPTNSQQKGHLFYIEKQKGKNYKAA